MRRSFNSHLRESFKHIPGEVRDIESKSAMLCLHCGGGLPKLWLQGCWCLSRRQSSNLLVDTGGEGCCQAEEGVLWGLFGLWDSGSSYRQSKQHAAWVVAEAKSQGWEDFVGGCAADLNSGRCGSVGRVL
ncbi:hypothetical protein CHARACLAT_030769 [Characodon lateralis]|uniref:Uncharacterized protein n=1 Tax=Characodon lateralis TaxID=208331 RepID=A0ABU7EYH0_9TELE|nr:hypothetical protein [Characodon lateralis]